MVSRLRAAAVACLASVAVALPVMLVTPTTATAETSSATTQSVTASKAAAKKVSAGLTKADLAEIEQVEARNRSKNKIRSTDAASRTAALPPLRVVYNSRGSNRGELIASRTRGRGSLDIVSRGEISEFGGYSIKQNAGCQLWIGSIIRYRASDTDHWRYLPPAWEIWTKTRCPAGTESW